MVAFLIGTVATTLADTEMDARDFAGYYAIARSFIDKCGDHLNVDRERLAQLENKWEGILLSENRAAALDSYKLGYLIEGDQFTRMGQERLCKIAPNILDSVYGNENPVRGLR